MFKNRRMLGISALLSVLVLLLSACGSGSAGSGGGGESVAVGGATKEQYTAALAGMEPVTLSMQLPTSEGSQTSSPQEAWAKAVEEWSGGKIKFDILYSGSRVPVYQMANGIADGLVDSGYVLLYTEPERFPNNALLTDLMFLNKTDPIAGQLQMAATWIDFTYTEASIRQEAASQGMELIIRPARWATPPSSARTPRPPSCPTSAASRSGPARRPTCRSSRPRGGDRVGHPDPGAVPGAAACTVDCAVTVPSLTLSMSLNEVAKVGPPTRA